MQKVIKVGALLIVSTGIIYASYIMYDEYIKKNKEKNKGLDFDDLQWKIEFYTYDETL